MAPGLIDWVTQDTHLGLYRNYFGQDVDDTFIADNEWSSQYQCTPAATDPPDYTCPAGVAKQPGRHRLPDVQMSAADVAYVAAWEQQTGITLNLAFNGVGACTAPSAADQSSAICTGSTPSNGTTYTDPGQAIDPTAPNDAGLRQRPAGRPGRLQLDHPYLVPRVPGLHGLAAPGRSPA